MSTTPPDAVRATAAAESPLSHDVKFHDLQPQKGSGISNGTSPLRRVAAALAGVLALFGLACLATVLFLALQGRTVEPWLVAATFYALPLAFVLMAGLVIDSIRRRRRG